MIPKVTIWIDDDEGGCFPLDAEIRREGAYIIIVNRTIRIKVLADTIMMALGDEGHG